MKTLQVKGRAIWAKYLIHGDTSGLTPLMRKDADEWMAAIRETNPDAKFVAVTAVSKPVSAKFNGPARPYGKSTKVATYKVRLSAPDKSVKSVTAALEAAGKGKLAKQIRGTLFSEPADLYDAALDFAHHKGAAGDSPAFADAVAEFVTRARSDDITKNLTMKMIRREFPKAFPARAAAADGTWGHTADGKVFIPEHQFPKVPKGFTTKPLRGYRHTLAVFDNNGDCVGWKEDEERS